LRVIFLPVAVIFPIIAPMSTEQQHFKKAGAYEGTRQIVCVEKAITAEELPNAPVFVDFSKGRVFLCELCNTDLDRHQDRFTIPVLQKFATDSTTGNGRIMLFDHDRGNPIGRVFGGYVNGEKLMGYAYIHNAMVLPKQPGVKIADAIEDRILTDVSVGFRGHLREKESAGVNMGGNEWEWYIPATGPNVTELNELSVVSIGAQPLAGFKSIDSPAADQKAKSKIINMSAQKSIHIGGKEFDITAKQDGDSIKIDATAVNDAVKALETAKAEVDAKLKTATDDNTALKAELAAVREPFETQVLNHEKTKGAAALTDEQVKAMPFAQLQAKAAEAEKATASDNGTKTESKPVHFDKYKD